MPTRPRMPRDVNQIAYSVVQQATGQIPKIDPPSFKKNPAAVALGLLGGAKGGTARAKGMTPKQRSTAAKKAAQARWSKK